ncbi:MAG: sugar phosphate isomerase/epimerase family protein [Planctomycetota bacterium]|jgi:sugar phosphate isomerase/epimerase
MTRLGVCSWSLQPATPAHLVESVRETSLTGVQLALDPLRIGHWSEQETRDALETAGIAVLSGMACMHGEDYSTIQRIRETGGLRPRRHWRRNLRASRDNAALAARLGVRLVSFHAGFLPEDAADPERTRLLKRLEAVTDAYAEAGVSVALETGQESAATLLAVLTDLARPTLGVNFDPANMLLYGTGDPVEALAALRPHVLQMHVKDARSSGVAETWGTEVPVGEGEVDWPAVLHLLRSDGPPCDLLVEREAGTERVADVRRAVALLHGQGAGDVGASGGVT